MGFRFINHSFLSCINPSPCLWSYIAYEPKLTETLAFAGKATYSKIVNPVSA